MKRLPIIILLAALVAMMPACHHDDDDSWKEAYMEWKANNESWLTQQQARKNADGSPYFKTIVPEWNPSAYVLIHYFGDTEANAGNLVPMSTSTVDVRYYGYYYNDVPLDSSVNQTTYGPGIFRTQLNKVIEGWTIAFETMHVGDSAEIVIPYQSAYGISSTGTVPPYSNLRFNVRLVDVYKYEANPK